MSAIYPVYSMVTDILQFGEGVNYQIARYRQRVLKDVQRVVDDTWVFRNWGFRHASATKTADTNGLFFAPNDFLSIGPGGNLTVSGQVEPLKWMSPRDYNRAKSVVWLQRGIPKFYTELDVVDDTRRLAVYPFPASGFDTILFDYDRTSPALVDDFPTNEANGGIEEIPAQWHRSVIYNGVIFYQMKSKGNPQSRSEQWDLYQKGLQKMAFEERGGRSETHNLPAYGMRRGIGRFR